MHQPFLNQLWAIDANWRHIRNARCRQLTPNGIKAVFFQYFVHSTRLLRSTVAVKKMVTLLFHSAPFRRHYTVHASRTVSVPYARVHNKLGVVFRCAKKEGQLVDSPTRINSFILLWSSKLFWGSLLLPLFDFERVLRLRLDWVCMKSAIDDRSTLHCQSTLIASKCNRLDGVMLLLAFLGS